VLDDLTFDERALVDAAREGRELTCAEGTEIRAELIRELLLGKRMALDPRGVRLRRARVVGGLDLDHVTAEAGLSLVDCAIAERMTLLAATLPWLEMTGSHIDGIHAPGLRVSGDLKLGETTVSGGSGPAPHADRLKVDGRV
jgi:hypothetical protein